MTGRIFLHLAHSSRTPVLASSMQGAQGTGAYVLHPK